MDLSENGWEDWVWRLWPFNKEVAQRTEALQQAASTVVVPQPTKKRKLTEEQEEEEEEISVVVPPSTPAPAKKRKLIKLEVKKEDLVFERIDRDDNDVKSWETQYAQILAVAKEYCRGGIEEIFVRRVGVVDVNSIFMAKSIEQEANVAFALIERVKPPRGVHIVDTWYVHLICSLPGGGGALLSHIINEACKAGVQYLKLAALPTVLGFYRRYGFLFASRYEKCKDVDKVRKSMPATFPVFRNEEEAYKDKSIVEFLDLLIENNLVANMECKKAKTTKTSKPITEEDRRMNKIRECSIYGYTMTLCLNPMQTDVCRRAR